MNITISSGSTSVAGKGCATLFLGVFLVMGLVFAGLLGKAGYESLRTYFWDPTSCTIEESSADEGHGGASFHVRYSYTVKGRTYAGTRYKAGSNSRMDAADAERAVQRFPADSKATCHVNPSAPEESVLVREAPWILLFLVIPLLFVAIGAGGIIGVWRSKPEAVKAVSERHGSRTRGVFGLRVFASIFILVGAGAMYGLLVRPTLRSFAAAGWPSVPCEVISSRVGVHSGDEGGSTYSVNIRYRYRFGGRDYTGTRYNFDTGSSSGRGWKDEVVRAHPPGLRTVCHVNPSDPLDSVLTTKASSDRWFGLIPGVFLAVGLLLFLKAPAMAGNRMQGIAAPIVSGVPAVPEPLAGGPVELKPASTPLAGFIAIAIGALFWNGIVWAILLNLGKNGGGRFFLGIFALIGAGLIALVAYQFLSLFNPRPILVASSQAIPLGGTLDIQWRFAGSVQRLTMLRIFLEGREEATYRRGTTTSTDRNIFANLTLIETRDRAVMREGSALLIIPAGLIHTFSSGNNKIIWMLRVAGEIPMWPDVGAEFPIVVLPLEPGAQPATATSAS